VFDNGQVGGGTRVTSTAAGIVGDVGALATRLAGQLWTHPVEVVFTCLMAAALAVVARRRKLGWCLGLTAQSVILAYGLATDNAGYYPAGVAIVIYLRNLWLRRGETWRAIPTARELARRGCECTTCCVHGTPTQAPGRRHAEIR
jgi:peptidoglycan/LPS O-acetylase OafA/YrhL